MSEINTLKAELVYWQRVIGDRMGANDRRFSDMVRDLKDTLSDPAPAAPTSVQISQLDDASNACLELAAAHGFATGHGDTVADMIREFSAQIPQRSAAMTDDAAEQLVIAHLDLDRLGVIRDDEDRELSLSERIAELSRTTATSDVPDLHVLRSVDDWNEDMGDMLWWRIEADGTAHEAPWVGHPLVVGVTVEAHTTTRIITQINQEHDPEPVIERINVGGWIEDYYTHFSEIPRLSIPRNQRPGEAS